MPSNMLLILLVTMVGVPSILGDTFKLNVGKVVRSVDEKFLSYTLDSYAIQSKWINKNISSKKFLNVSKPLAPAYFRVGGTLEDQVIFKANPDSADIYVPEDYNHFVLSGEDFILMNEYAINAGVNLVYGLNAQIREGTDWNPLNSPFNTTNAKQLIQFADDHKYNIVWQLGNEPNAFSGKYKTTPKQLEKDFEDLRKVLDTFPRYTQLIGPDVSYVDSFLSDFAKAGVSAINALTFHHYYINGETAKVDDFTNPDILNKLTPLISAAQKALDDVDSDLPIWLSETSSAFPAGAVNISDRFVAGFSWIDKLGICAVTGVKYVIRQQIVGGHYPLINSNMDPNPDWFLSVLYKRLVGTKVLEVSVPTGEVRLYAHCVSSKAGQPKGAVVVYGSNVGIEEVQLDVSSVSNETTQVLAYVITGESGLQSQTVLLNQKRLELGSDGSLPDFEPEEIDSDNIVLPPQSILFYVFPDVNYEGC